VLRDVFVCMVIGLTACRASDGQQALVASQASRQDDIPQIPVLSAWYRADNVTKGDKNVLTTLSDCSGKGRNIVPGPYPPRVLANAINGKPILRFDGRQTTLIDEGNNWSANGFTVFVVASYDEVNQKPVMRNNRRVSVGQALVSDGGDAGLALGLNFNGRPGMAGGISMANPETAYEPPYATEQSSDLAISAGKFYVFAYSSTEGKNNSSWNAWSCRLKVSVFANGMASPTVPNPFISTQAMNGGKKLQIGAAGARECFKGNIAEIITFNTELSEADRGKVFSYLRSKYRLQETCKLLPTGPVVIVPTFENRTYWFRDSVTVEMATPTEGATIHYTTDGSPPSEKSPLYSTPVKMTESTTVLARAFAPNRDASPVTTATFIRIMPMKPTANKLTGGWRLSWGDEFNGPEVDESIWDYETGYVRNSEAQCYTKRKENSRIDNGNLLIQGLHDNWNGHEYTSASRSTENNVILTYGRYEMRGKIDIRSGSWPAWWIFSNPGGGGHPAEGEIDMMEYYTRHTLFNIMDAAQKWNVHKRSINSLGGNRWATAFHVWTMDWDSEKIDLYLDGTLMLHYLVDDANNTGPNGSNPFRHPDRKKMILNQALGGRWGGPLSPKDAPFELRVDWVRVHTWSNETAYTLTVNAGAGSGPYVVNTRASITANMSPPGYVFDEWVVDGNAAINDPTNPSAILIMPASDVTVTATYRPE